MTPLQQAAQELVDRIANLSAWPLDWAEYAALEKALADEQAQEPVAQWQKWHKFRTNGRWENTNEHDAKWWRDHSVGWEVRTLFTHPAPPATGERADLITHLRNHSSKLGNRAADMLEADAREVECFTNNLAAEKSIYDSAAIKNERLQAEIATLKAQQVAAPATVATLKRYEPELYDDRVRMELDSDGDWVKYADFLAHQVAVLSDIDQYRMQMAGISTAALGYWSEGDEIHPDYDTPALRDVARLYAKYDQLFKEKEARRAQQVAAPDGNWLWCKLMDFCKKRGYAPTSFDDLFAIVGEARAQQVAVPMSDSEIETLREKTFSTDNPYCPVDSKSMRKAVRATESHYGIVSK